MEWIVQFGCTAEGWWASIEDASETRIRGRLNVHRVIASRRPGLWEAVEIAYSKWMEVFGPARLAAKNSFVAPVETVAL